jgi:AraC family transcriptional regulator
MDVVNPIVRRWQQDAAADPDAFWARAAEELHWFRRWDTTFVWEPPTFKWFVGGLTNIAYNCLDLQVTRGRGEFGRVAPKLWERFLSAVRALGLVEQPLLFMGLDDPDIVGPARCRMDACVQLPDGFGAALPCPPPLLHKRLPARWVATLDYEGPSEDIGEGWTALLTQWLPESGYKLSIGPFFERYDPAFGAPGVRSVRCRLGMPVEPRAC